MGDAVWSSQVVKGEKIEKCMRPLGCHGNAEIHMCTKFHLHALYGLLV